jgi:hypothetical protein
LIKKYNGGHGRKKTLKKEKRGKIEEQIQRERIKKVKHIKIKRQTVNRRTLKKEKIYRHINR